MPKKKHQAKKITHIEENIQKLKQGVKNNIIQLKKNSKKKGVLDGKHAEDINIYIGKAAQLLKLKEDRFKERVENPKQVSISE
jgi:hypothetical protein